MNNSDLQAVKNALAGYSAGDLLALSDLHEAISKLIETLPESEALLDLNGCLTAIETQLSGGNYELDDLFFENIQRILDTFEGAGPVAARAPAPAGDEAVNLEYLPNFCVELQERLSLAQELVLTIERGADPETVAVLFRLFHTIKGEAGFLKLTRLGELFHSLENLLDGLRKNHLTVTPELTDVLFVGLDLAERCHALLAASDTDLRPLSEDIEAVKASVSTVLEGKRPPLGKIMEDRGLLSADQSVAVAELQKAEGFQKRFGEIAKDQHLLTEDQINEGLRLQNESAQNVRSTAKQEENLVKVSGSKLSYLVDMVGEMLILQNQLSEDGKEVQQLRKISREVQQAAMSLRTTNLRPLFTKVRRAVRDIARQLNKSVAVEVRGEGNEIDRTLIEAMEEPLIHLVRNCVSHGIEDEETRAQASKPREGSVVVSGERRGNHVILSIRDDGKGLNTQAILNNAVKNGLVSEASASKLRDSEIHDLIFRDGLSTAERVDDISGRGVGMSIVKKTVEKFRGFIDIKTKPGEFTEFSLVFPLSMALIDGMIVDLRKDKFILPVANVFESVRLLDEMVVTLQAGGQVLRLRGEIVPLIDLGEFFYGSSNGGKALKPVAVIVENNLHERCAFVVDEVLDKREVVIKSLGARFARLEGISAAAILRGGEIGYLVDVDRITVNRVPVQGGAA